MSGSKKSLRVWLTRATIRMLLLETGVLSEFTNYWTTDSMCIACRLGLGA
jgi:hypothetical protein